MPAQNPARLAAVGSVAAIPVPRRFNISILLAALLSLTGCATRPSGLAAPDPSDPGVRTSRAEYSSTIGRYTRQRPVSPTGWQKQNELVTPAPKSSE